MFAMISTMMDTLRVQLTEESSDCTAVLALSAIAWSVVFPLTLIWNAYLFSVGYAAAVAVIALCLINSFQVPLLTVRGRKKPHEILAWIVLLHGLRLTVFLIHREYSVKRMRDQVRAFHNKYPGYILVVLATVVSMLYASMVSPLFYALRRPADDANVVLVWAGTILAFAGFLIEAIADQHKSNIKRSHGIFYGEKRFVGPTTGLYGICRHPNFAGELLFWTGLLVAGLPSFHQSGISWISSLAGWVCIASIMRTSATNLDRKQDEWYSQQPTFEAWKKKVKGSLLPGIPFPSKA